MSLERASLERDPNAPTWCDPIAMLVAWLARVFAQITNLKRIRRTTKFKPNWRDHWSGLRRCEWLRDQTLAAGAAQLLAGKPLDLSNFIPTQDPPANYGGPCPRTPFEMNRRFLALARFNADPEVAIRKHAARISGCPLRLASRSTSPALRAMEEINNDVHGCLSSCGAPRRGRWHALAHDGGGSRSPRGPPLTPQNPKSHLAGITCENAPSRLCAPSASAQTPCRPNTPPRTSKSALYPQP